MTLTIGTGPFGDQGDKVFNFEVRAPRDHVLYLEDSPRRVRVRPALHRIAFPVVSEWYQYHPCIRVTWSSTPSSFQYKSG